MRIEEDHIEGIERFNDGAEVSGLFVRVPNGYTVVAQGLDGKLRVKGAGLRFFYPWDKKYVYCISNKSMDFQKENYKSKEEFEIIIDTAVTYRISDVIKFHVQRNGLEQLKLLISELLRTYISKHTFEEISNWTLNIRADYRRYNRAESNAYDDLMYQFNDRENGANSDGLTEDQIIKKINSFDSTYGISVENIIIQKAELTDELKRSKEEDALTKAKNKRMVDTANAELEAAKLKAQADLETAKYKAKADKEIGNI